MGDDLSDIQTAVNLDLHHSMFAAPDTILVYMHKAKEHIDGVFGEGYAKKNPKLVGDFICAAATDFNGAVIYKSLMTIADCIDTGLGGIETRIMEMEGMGE